MADESSLILALASAIKAQPGEFAAAMAERPGSISAILAAESAEIEEAVSRFSTEKMPRSELADVLQGNRDLLTNVLAAEAVAVAGAAIRTVAPNTPAYLASVLADRYGRDG